MKVRFLREAERELDAAVHWYESQQIGLGTRFENSVWAMIELIQATPESGRRIAKTSWRRIVRRFPYAIVYETRTDHILVVAIMHLHRRPGYWRQRLS